jgi:mono/diheme cytochrome c family protein
LAKNDAPRGTVFVTNIKIGLVVVGTLGLYTLVANSIPQVQSEVPEMLSFGADVSVAELVSAGEELFQGAGGCMACHGLGERAPNLRTAEGSEGTIGARCGSRVPGEDCKTYLHQSMVAPSDFVVEGYQPIMPDMRRTLSETQIWALVAYLENLGGEVTVTGADIATTEGAAAPSGDVTAGAAPAPGGTAGAGAVGGMDPIALIDNNLCVNCHTIDDRGVELGPSFNGIGSRLDADYIRTSILDPGAGASEGFEQLIGVMPTNFGQMFTASQLEAIVTYLAGRTEG